MSALPWLAPARLGVKTLIPLFLAFVLSGFGVRSAQGYYGRRSTEAMLHFEAEAEVPLRGASSLKPGRLLELLNDPMSPWRGKALARIDRQVQHLMGSFQSESFVARFRHPGVLGESYEIRFLSVQPGTSAERERVRYEFSGKVVFRNSAFARRELRDDVPIVLPLAPDRVYSLGVVRGKNRCTDSDYNDEEDFWYFWDPEMPGCPLAGDPQNVIRTVGRLERIPNSSDRYPEYERLYGDNGNGDVLDIAVFFGFFHEPKSLNRADRRDLAYQAFRAFAAFLDKSGFELTESLDDFRVRKESRGDARGPLERIRGANALRVFEKVVRTALGKSIRARVQILVSDTEMESRDSTFHEYLIPALRRADIVLYDGHSGLGGNLDLKALKGERFDPEKYQIFIFNGCSTYPYFNGSFFRAKRGTANLEVITSGLPTFAGTSAPNTVALLGPFLNGYLTSYPRILGALERSNGEYETSLMGVSGEQDNRFSPRTR